MKIQSRTITFFLWGLVLVSRVLINMEGTGGISPLAIYYSSSVLLLFWLIFIRLNTSVISKKSPLLLWGIAFVLYAVIFGKIFSNPMLTELIDFNFIAMIIFYVLMFGMASYLKSEEKIIVFLKISYFVLLFCIFVLTISNWNGLIGIKDLVMNLFGGYTRSRLSFGFYHPNVAANIALCIILISSILMQYNKRKINYYVVDIFMIYVILSTASRSTMCALILFVIIQLFSSISRKISNRILKSIFIFLFLLGVVFLFLFSSDDSIEKLFEISNRSYNFIYNIPVLIKSGRFMIGLGFIGSGDFFQLSHYNTFYVDNYFLYVLMSTGLIGLIFVSSFILYLFYNLCFKVKRYDKLTYLTGGIFLTNLFSSLGETCFMYPSFTSCFVYTVLYLAVINYKRDYMEGE